MRILITQFALPSILSLKKIEIQNLSLVQKNVKLHSNLPVHVAVLHQIVTMMSQEQNG